MIESKASNEEIATRLDKAEQACIAIAPLSETQAAFTPQSAYEIQSAWLQMKLARGAQLVGHKIGLTSQAMQKQLGVDQPDYGFLLDTMVVPSNTVLSRNTFILPRIEPEIAFLLKTDLRGPGITAEQVMQATQEVRAALELVDSRITDWRIKLADTIADNASSARMILSDQTFSPDQVNLARESVALFRNADQIDTGKGEAVLGHPAEAVAWLANKLADFDIGLQAGQWVLPGAMCASALVVAGNTYTAVFSVLGEVSISFT